MKLGIFAAAAISAALVSAASAAQENDKPKSPADRRGRQGDGGQRWSDAIQRRYTLTNAAGKDGATGITSSPASKTTATSSTI